MKKRQGKLKRFFRFRFTSRNPPPSPPTRPLGLTTTAGPGVCQTPGLPVSPDPSPPAPDPSLKEPAGVVVVVSGGVSTRKTNPALELAIENHIKGLSAAEQQTFRDGASESDLLARAAELDAKHNESSSFRPHTEKITKVLKFCDKFMGGVAIGIQANPDISSIIVGGVRVFLDIAIRFVTYFAKLTDMISRLTDYLQALAIYGNIGDDRITEPTAAAYGDLLKFCQKASSIFVPDTGGRERTWMILLKEQWEPFETIFGEIEISFRHHVAIVDNSANALQLDMLIKREKSEDKSMFLEWLSGSGAGFDKRHMDIFSKKHPGTADWLLNSKEFKSWVDSPDSSLLWCYGNPGAGKSVIASNVVQHFSGKHLFHETIGVSYVYYHHGDGALQDLSLVIAGILLPICRKLDKIPDWLNKHKKDGFSPSAVCTTELFCSVAQKFDQVILIVDALDECPKEARYKMIGFLDKVMKITKAKIFVTSRKESDIETAFNDAKVPMIEIQVDDTAEDIKTFVTEELRSLRQGLYGKKFYLSDDSLEDVIIEFLTKKSDGMFLWVYFQLEHLCKVSQARQDQRIHDELHRLPSGLDGTYKRMLRDIDARLEYDKQIALNTLMWVLHAKRPLSKAELRYAVTLSNDPDSDVKHLNLVNFDFLLDSCQNFVIDDGELIRLVHYSAKQFLTNSDFGFMGLQPSTIQKAHIANEKLTSSCLSCLQHLPHIGGRQREQYDKLLEFLEERPFVLYAAHYFDAHISLCLDAGSPTKCYLNGVDVVFETSDILTIFRLRRMRPPYPSRRSWNDIQWSENHMDLNRAVYATSLIRVPQIRKKYASGDPPSDALHLVVVNKDRDAATRLITNGYEINKLNKQGVCALYYTCELGHIQIVSLLMDYRADVNVAGGDHGSPLQAASANGHEGIVQMLLEHGADVDVACGLYGSPLQAASARGHERIVQMLLDQGAHNDLQNRKGIYLTALDAALQHKNRKISRLLADSVVDINAQCGEYGAPLQAALVAQDYSLANLFLERGADVNANPTKYGTALAIASNQLNEEMVVRLLDRGANINAVVGGDMGSALQAAARMPIFEAREVVKLLLKRGADINLRGDTLGTPPLTIAVKWGHKETVRLFLDCGADIEAQEDSSGSPISAAAYFGRIDLVELLLDRGADINAAGGAALRAASCLGFEDIVELLIDRGADVNAVNPGGSSALAGAYINGHKKIMAWLLVAGAEDVRSAYEEEAVDFRPFDHLFSEFF
ncbi:hypothetical protein EMCG_01016 [[Emmonsia] crescens]|uniref:Nephrocystin 3-like N-terminal domain-containing protein n=1 Tax=[Emmonsia] crescens TaxID=73230 RepID=A0A0G2ID33_9EURO|nr:hypothetical protein EMCG_01016 [Emmonsia crescens UAMH 3008]